MKIKVMSLWQPWALAMWNGLKIYETRDAHAPVVAQLRGYEGWLGIHAAKMPWLKAIDKSFSDPDEARAFAQKFLAYANDAPVDKTDYGTVGGICRFSGIYQTQQIAPKLSKVELFFGDYSEGRRALHCPGMIKLPEPVPLRGMQGLFDWEVPAEIAARLQ